jgi:hypothetical protein
MAGVDFFVVGGFVNLVEAQYLGVMIGERFCGRLQFRHYLDETISDFLLWRTELHSGTN